MNEEGRGPGVVGAAKLAALAGALVLAITTPAGSSADDPIIAYGLRNPFRASFDPATDQLIIGDVGEGDREEIDVIPAGSSGQNFGWVRFEGTAVFNASATATGGSLARCWSPTPPAPHARVRRRWTQGWHRSQPGWLGGTASTHGSSPPRMPVPTSSLSRRRAAATPGCGAMPIR